MKILQTSLLLFFVLSISSNVQASETSVPYFSVVDGVNIKDCLKRFAKGKVLYSRSVPSSQTNLQEIYFVTSKGKILGITTNNKREIACNRYEIFDD